MSCVDDLLNVYLLAVLKCLNTASQQSQKGVSCVNGYMLHSLKTSVYNLI